MAFKKISARMTVFILPVVILAMVILTTVSAITSRNLVEKEIKNYMNSELTSQERMIQQYLEIVARTSMSLSRTVAISYKSASQEDLERTLETIIMDDDLILGSGIWFEPYVYDSTEKYFGPYVYKDGDSTVTTYDYSNAEYDYFNQEFYTITKNTTEPVVTNPYYDETSGLTMSSVSMPLLDPDGNYLGCVTVDISLDSIQNVVNSITIGTNGNIYLIDSDGTFIAGVDNSKIQNQDNLLTDSSLGDSYMNAANVVIGQESGETEYTTDSDTYQVYFTTIDVSGWKMLIVMPESELFQPIKTMILKMILICVAALGFTGIAIFFQVRGISLQIKKVAGFSNALSDGDFTISDLEVRTQDEVGEMGTNLNQMYNNNKTMIQNISEKAEELDISGRSLTDSASQLKEQFARIESFMEQVNDAMMSTSAATEEVNASAEEVNTSINLLRGETEKMKTMATEIRGRASGIRSSSKDAHDNAIRISTAFSEKLKISMENAKVVENIGEMAEVISTIAEQINLLSLNASIEAARAGESGRGFAVVAAEIGKLANETATAVGQIQNTIESVKDAFNKLTQEVSVLFEFVQKTVTPDYIRFVEVADQYGEDAGTIELNMDKVAEMTNDIHLIMNDVNYAIQNIAESAQSTANNSAGIMSAVEEVSEEAGQLTDLSKEQKNISNELGLMVKKFKI